MSGIGERTTEGRGKLYSSILDTIGNTPVVQVKKLVPDTVRLYVKAEFFNPETIKENISNLSMSNYKIKELYLCPIKNSKIYEFSAEK